MPGLSRALEPAWGSKVAFGRLLLPPVTKKGLFFGPKIARKTRDANTGLPSTWDSSWDLGWRGVGVGVLTFI